MIVFNRVVEFLSPLNIILLSVSGMYLHGMGIRGESILAVLVSSLVAGVICQQLIHSLSEIRKND